MRDFNGRLVLVTGAGSGIGRATALAFARRGARIVAVDIDGQSAEATAADARALGVEADARSADVASAAAMEELAADLATAPGVPDVVVNNAGIGIAGAFLDMTVDDWERLLGVNLWGVIHGCRLFARQMVDRGQGGHIVNVASAAAFLPSKTLPAYCTSKAAVLMLSECLQADFAAHGIGVTAICPGFIATPITQSARFVGRSEAEQARLRQRATRLYRRRNYTPERVAERIVRAVERNAAVAPVAPEAHFFRALSRAAPGLVRRLARLDPAR